MNAFNKNLLRKERKIANSAFFYLKKNIFPLKKKIKI